MQVSFSREELLVEAEDSNRPDKHTVAVIKGRCVVGHALVTH